MANEHVRMFISSIVLVVSLVGLLIICNRANKYIHYEDEEPEWI